MLVPLLAYSQNVKVPKFATVVPTRVFAQSIVEPKLILLVNKVNKLSIFQHLPQVSRYGDPNRFIPTLSFSEELETPNTFQFFNDRSFRHRRRLKNDRRRRNGLGTHVPVLVIRDRERLPTPKLKLNPAILYITSNIQPPTYGTNNNACHIFQYLYAPVLVYNYKVPALNIYGTLESLSHSTVSIKPNVLVLHQNVLRPSVGANNKSIDLLTFKQQFNIPYIQNPALNINEYLNNVTISSKYNINNLVLSESVAAPSIIRKSNVNALTQIQLLKTPKLIRNLQIPCVQSSENLFEPDARLKFSVYVPRLGSAQSISTPRLNLQKQVSTLVQQQSLRTVKAILKHNIATLQLRFVGKEPVVQTISNDYKITSFAEERIIFRPAEHRSIITIDFIRYVTSTDEIRGIV